MFAIALSLVAPSHAEDALPAGATAATTYTLEAADSRLYVLVKYDRDALIAGHDHVVVAQQFDGSVTWNPADPSACDVRISFPVTALAVDPGSSRSWEGLEGATSDGDKSSIAKNLQGKSQLHAAMFPRIAFTSKSCKRSGAGFEVTGSLGIHGVDAPVTALMRIEADADGFSAKGRFSASHSKWSMDPFTAMFGSLRNDDTLEFVVDVNGHAAR